MPGASRLRRTARYGSLVLPVLRSQRGRLAAPWKLTLATTYVCNHRCVHCGIWKRRPQGEMSTGDFEALFAANPQLAWLDLTGGEPTSRPDFPEIIRSANRHLRRLVVLHFPTNGMRPRRAEAAARAAVEDPAARTLLTVSLDGPPALHDHIRGVTGAWDAAIESFERLERIDGVEVVFGMTLTAANTATLAETVAAARGKLPHLGPAAFHFNIAQRSAHYYDNLDLSPPDPHEASRALAAFARGGRVPTSIPALVESAFRGWIPRFLETGRSPVPCGALSVSCFVDPWGTAYPCITEDRPLGSLRDHGWSLARMWQVTSDARVDVEADRCTGCWAFCEGVPSLLADLPAAARGAGRHSLGLARW
jgi:MoaA/NifB/PqqE/SkfB family radical SAM enzyme